MTFKNTPLNSIEIVIPQFRAIGFSIFGHLLRWLLSEAEKCGFLAVDGYSGRIHALYLPKPSAHELLRLRQSLSLSF